MGYLQRVTKNYSKLCSSAEGTSWDYVILTACDEHQKSFYQMQINLRLRGNFLSPSSSYTLLLTLLVAPTAKLDDELGLGERPFTPWRTS